MWASTSQMQISSIHINKITQQYTPVPLNRLIYFVVVHHGFTFQLEVCEDGWKGGGGCSVFRNFVRYRYWFLCSIFWIYSSEHVDIFWNFYFRCTTPQSKCFNYFTFFNSFDKLSSWFVSFVHLHMHYICVYYHSNVTRKCNWILFILVNYTAISATSQ